METSYNYVIYFARIFVISFKNCSKSLTISVVFNMSRYCRIAKFAGKVCLILIANLIVIMIILKNKYFQKIENLEKREVWTR